MDQRSLRLWLDRATVKIQALITLLFFEPSLIILLEVENILPTFMVISGRWGIRGIILISFSEKKTIIVVLMQLEERPPRLMFGRAFGHA